MKRFNVAVAIVLLTTSGCATSVNLPVVGRLSNGETAQGNVVIDLATRQGEFDIVTLSGLRCDGTYDADLRVNTIAIPVACNNGSIGTIIATRDATGVAGTASGKLDNGMTGRFLFGNVSAEMQADFLDE